MNMAIIFCMPTAPFEKEDSHIKEAIAYVVMNHFGYDTGKCSFGYIAEWCQVYSLYNMKKIGSDIVRCSTLFYL